MRDMQPVTPEVFQTYLAANPNLTQRRVGGMQCYLADGEWPESLVASFMPASETRRRDGGWRIAVEISDDAQGI